MRTTKRQRRSLLVVAAIVSAPVSWWVINRIVDTQQRQQGPASHVAAVVLATIRQHPEFENVNVMISEERQGPLLVEGTVKNLRDLDKLESVLSVRHTKPDLVIKVSVQRIGNE